jgi:hypothetical protein
MADPWNPPLNDPNILEDTLFLKGSRRAVQTPPRVRTRPEIRDRTRLPGFMNAQRVAEQWDEDNHTLGSQFGHPNDEAHAWVWL